MRYTFTLLLFVTSFYLFQCNSFFDGGVEDGLVSSEFADPTLLLNNLQLKTRDIFHESSSFGSELTRMHYMLGETYREAFSPDEFDDIYNDVYVDIFTSANALFAIAESKNLFVHLGVAKILKANAMITLVDNFGDMPYTETFDGTDLNPTLEDDQVIYNEALNYLDQSIADLSNPLTRDKPESDLYFGSFSEDERIELWIRVANTLKLKAHLNMGNQEEVLALVEEGNLITESTHDFQFSYGTNSAQPDSRHPRFAVNYIDGVYTSDFMAVSFMNMLLTDKRFRDPRINYYIFRQLGADEDLENENLCVFSAPPSHFDEDDPYCQLPYGYWGRDHLMEDGIPMESPLPTFGIYPTGGAFDDGLGGDADANSGLRGAGLEPILLSAFTHFMIAEIELVFNNNVSGARQSLELALEHAFTKVADFGQDYASGSSFEITDSTITAYQAEVLNRYDNASDNSEKLRVIALEYYFSLWGNGYEAYNLMRRTGFPDRDDNLQPSRSPIPGNWPRSLLYPATMVNRNASIDQKQYGQFLFGPFWDPEPGSTKFNF